MRLIDADKLKISYDGHFVGVAKNDLDNAPTIEAEPIIHAHWVKDKNFDGFKIWKCSNCLCRFGDYISTEWGINPTQYAYGKRCGYCGAVMDGVEPHKDCCDYLDENCNCRLEDGQCNYQPLCNAGDCSMCVE